MTFIFSVAPLPFKFSNFNWNSSIEVRFSLSTQAITALAHIRAAVLYVMDVSEQCNHSLEEQIALFENIKPLFTNKPIIVCLNKIDIVNVDDLPEEKKNLLSVLNEDGR